MQTSSGFECIDNMADLRIAGPDDDADDVKACRSVEQVMPGQVVKSRYTDLLLFTSVHSLQWGAEVGCSSCFDFNKNDGMPVPADNINFAAFLPIISGNDIETAGCEKIGGNIFAAFTETDSFC